MLHDIIHDNDKQPKTPEIKSDNCKKPVNHFDFSRSHVRVVLSQECTKR